MASLPSQQVPTPPPTSPSTTPPGPYNAEPILAIVPITYEFLTIHHDQYSTLATTTKEDKIVKGTLFLRERHLTERDQLVQWVDVGRRIHAKKVRSQSAHLHQLGPGTATQTEAVGMHLWVEVSRVGDGRRIEVEITGRNFGVVGGILSGEVREGEESMEARLVIRSEVHRWPKVMVSVEGRQ